MLIVYGSLYPGIFQYRHVAGGPLWFLLHQWDRVANTYLIRDIFANLLLYIPLGLSAGLAFGRRGAFAAIPFALALSFSIELAQIYLPTRQSSMVDVVCNTAGAAIGAGLTLLPKVRRHYRAGVGFLIACSLFCLLFPLVAVPHQFVHSPLVSSHPAPTALAIWYAAGLLLRAARVRYARLWLALSLLAIPAQIHLVDKAPLALEAAGAVAGVFLFALRPPLSPVNAWEARLYLLCTAIAPLWPFRFSTHTRVFSFLPFEDLITADGPTGLWIILSQLAAWGTAIWLFSAAGMRRWAAVALVGAAVAAAQAARIFVPGATPGITPPLLAIIAGYMLEALAAGR